jgi:DNA-directed RNA polymerase specialized sigma54-like protein
MLLHAKQFELYANLFEKLEEHNEAQDMSAGKYKDAEWVIKDLKSRGFNVSK